MIAPKMSAEVAEITHGEPRNLAKTDPRRRDLLLDAVGRQRSAIPMKASRVAAAVGHSEGQESRIRNGQRMSPMGRAAIAVHEAVVAEGCPLERAGEVSAYVEVILRTVAMIPELDKLTTPALHQELRDEIARTETRANSTCNNLEGPYLADGPRALDIHAMLDAHTTQAAASTRIAAILQILAQRSQ